MTMPNTQPGMQNYIPIDKIIINEELSFAFDIYGKNINDDHVSLLYEKGITLLKEQVFNLISHTFLYVYESEKSFYDTFYTEFMNQKVIPENMVSFYQNMGARVDQIFKHPENPQNRVEAQTIVEDMITNMYKEDFSVSSFICILAHNYLTHTHSLNVCVYALCLGKHTGMPKKDLEALGIAALLHDIGKTRINPNILNKKGHLSDKEFSLIKKHSDYGWAIAKRMGIKNSKILDGIRFHHEKLDGTGYPHGLKKEEIPHFAKIIAVCDVFDALSTNRAYKHAATTFETLMTMKKEMSDHLEGVVVDFFIKIFRKENDL